MKYKLLVILFFISCSSHQKKISKEELEILNLQSLREVRPFLASDEFHFMKCDEYTTYQFETDNHDNHEHWKKFAHLELRKKAIKDGVNILGLSHLTFGKIQKYSAKGYRCKNVVDAKEVDPIGMCAASAERVFNLSLKLEQYPRKVGEEVLKQKIRYFAITHYYKTYSVKDIKFSYTKQEYTAKAAFFRCL